MQIGDGAFHLTYCTKIHPGHGWEELDRTLRRFLPPFREKMAKGRPFGLGLRLSAAESEELLAGDRLARFQEFLDHTGVYVFTLNGFPYGPFFGEPVKAQVFAPDWREEARLAYTLRLVDILARLLPEGQEGGISTLPLSYKPWIGAGDSETMGRIVHNLARLTLKLARTRQETGKLIHLDIEPEPDGLLEHSREVAEFYATWLLPQGAPLLAGMADLPVSAAEGLLLEHIRVCLDTCHLAVEFEDPAAALDTWAQHGIRVGKVQITAGLKARVSGKAGERDRLAAQLQPFTRSPYLHQVICRENGRGRRQYRDLEMALPHLGQARHSKWRIHYHVPLYVERYGLLASTRDDTRAVLQLLRERGFCRHLEIETYTWHLLPQGLKEDLQRSLELEYRWALDALGVQGPGYES